MAMELETSGGEQIQSVVAPNRRQDQNHTKKVTMCQHFGISWPAWPYLESSREMHSNKYKHA